MSGIHDQRLSKLFLLLNQMRQLSPLDKHRDLLVHSIRKEQIKLLSDGISESAINNLIHDKFAKFEKKND